MHNMECGLLLQTSLHSVLFVCLRDGLGLPVSWVGLGWVKIFSFFRLLGWVGSTVAKVLKF